MENPKSFTESLKPLYERASEAEDRLGRLEAALNTQRDADNEEQSKMVSELQSKLEEAKNERELEREKAQKLAVENAKLQYRIIHLVCALREANSKLACKEGHDS